MKEKIKGNEVDASLYVGVGGIGGRIIRKLVKLAKNDDLSKARFVIMDTDVNDLERADEESKIVQIQTSSPRTIRDYLMQDDDAREEWFPNNMIINSKTVSEGAGQVRSISRLALNATIRSGEINKLYRAIDDLYDKDGSDKKQTIKIAIASTVAGGTGSGIAMIIAMLIRNYISVNYHDSSAIIRGFMLMPGVMDTVIDSESERKNQRRNGYATIKEINAFMMRPFFEAVPELRRYMNLGIEVPNVSGGVDKLTCSPFDFCFLFDRTDGNVSNMPSMGQYQDYAAHSIYELCMGPMSAKAASKEDNIHREFLDDKKLSRNRFCGAGASVLRYPYEEIRDYVAYEWMEKQILGYSSEKVDEKEAKKLVANSWLAQDKAYQKKLDEYNENSTGLEEPKRSEIFVYGIDTGTDKLSERIREYYIARKNDKYKGEMNKKKGGSADVAEGGETKTIKKASEKPTVPAVEHYLDAVEKKVRELYEVSYKEILKDYNEFRFQGAEKEEMSNRYTCISGAKGIVDSEKIGKTAAALVNSIFESKSVMTDKAPAEYMLEDFLSLDGKALHPNAMRYLLYKLYDRLDEITKKNPPTDEAYAKVIETIEYGAPKANNPDDRDISEFQVWGLDGKQEDSLSAMCDAISNGGGGEPKRKQCNDKLTAYANVIDKYYRQFVRYYTCTEMKHYVEKLIKKFEDFYDRFERKVLGLAKNKKAILKKVEFKNGDCIFNIFGEAEHLKTFASLQTIPESGGREEIALFAGIYNGVKANSQVKDSVLSDEAEVDIFDEIMVKQYRKMVDDKTDLDMDILRAVGFEHQIICECKANETTNESIIEELKAKGQSVAEKNVHLIARIKKAQELACPSIIRKDFQEERAVNAMAFNKYLEERDGMTMNSKYFSDDYASDTVSSKELRFYRSIYDVMPTQLQKLCSPQTDPGKLSDCVDAVSCGDPTLVGSYFTAYQDYMRKIGPDNRLNPVITPHIDKRWNSVTVLPEIDPLVYQRELMKRIHKAMLYGFIFQIIEKRIPSRYDEKKLVYEYVDGTNGAKKFIVSNHTSCDRLFEVLDALYFDRYAVHSIHNTVDKKRKKEFETSTAYDDTTFAIRLATMDRSVLIDVEKRAKAAEEKLAGKAVSLFEIPLFYWNSIPKKDESEINIMVDAIFDIIEKEIGTFCNADDFAPLVAGLIVEHYNLMYKNVSAAPSVYMGDSKYVEKTKPEELLKNDVVVKIIRKKVLEKVNSLDVTRGGKFALVDKTSKDDLFM